MMHEIPDAISRELRKGEKLLWAGRPRQGVFLRGRDAFQIPFSIMWGGFALFWEYSVINSGAPILFRLWGVPFVVIGLYMMFGRFIGEAKQREHTSYAVTDERIIISSGVFSKTARSLNIKALLDVSLSENNSGSGTIHFGSAITPVRRGRVAPDFDEIENVRQVYDLILTQTSQKSA
jgi:hypothetical protein